MIQVLWIEKTIMERVLLQYIVDQLSSNQINRDPRDFGILVVHTKRYVSHIFLYG